MGLGPVRSALPDLMEVYPIDIFALRYTNC